MPQYGNEADDNPFRYCGEYYDNETEYIYLRARYYDPSTQRFVSEDPAFDGYNWYAYCGNNPVNRWDPSGLDWKDTVYGIAEAIDDNNFDGIVGWVAEKLTGKNNRVNDSQYDYYVGRVVGDAVSALIGAGATAEGIVTIIESIVAGGAISVGSGGTLTAGGVTISVAGVAAGTATVTYGSTVVTMSASNFNSDYSKMETAGKTEYKKPISGSGKEKATDVPSWAKGNVPHKNENGKDFANRLMDQHYGKGNWNTKSKDYSKIKKWGDRGFK